MNGEYFRKNGVWICREAQVKALLICLLIASSPQEGKIAGAYWFLLSGFGAMLSGTQLIWYILLVLLHKCSFVCISSFHLLPIFKKKKKKKKGESGAVCLYSLSCIHQLREPRNYSPSSVRKVNLLVPAHRWMTVVSSAGLLARRCVYTDVSDTHPPPPPPTLFNMFLFVFLVRKTKCCREGREKASRLECKAWWEVWWWQAGRIWYRCPLESLIASCW